MKSLLNSLLEIFPLPILIGIFIWIFSLCLFSFFLILIYTLLNQSASKRSESIISTKECSNEETHLKSVFSCDSLSLISIDKTQKDLQDEKINSFYLGNCNNLNKEIILSLPIVKLRTNENKQINTLTRRSIVKDLNSLSNSFKEKTLHQSIDSLFSKDSLIQ